MASYIRKLQSFGFEVEGVGDVDSALSDLSATPFPYDAVILDIMMPPGEAYADEDMDIETGVFLFRDIQKLSPSTPILVFTNKNPAPLRAYIAESARVRILYKPRVTDGRVGLGDVLKDLISVPEWFDEVVAEMNSLLELEPNWNGSGEPAVSVQILSAATDVVKAIVVETGRRPCVVPTLSGGVQIELHTSSCDFELEFLTDVSVSLFWHDGIESGHKEFDLEEGYRDDLVGLVNKVFS